MSNLRKTYTDIYDKHVNKIYRFIFLKVKSAEIAEDLCSEVFLRGWQSFKTQKDKIENIQAFLYQIARNLLADHYREASKAQLVSMEYVKTPNPGPGLEEKAFIQSDLERVKAALANIKEDYREVIVWYYLDELQVPEIAKILDKSEPTVRVLIHRALKALKNELE
jgi:RNA polymerase sigma-70 factor (ECF subfamily)